MEEQTELATHVTGGMRVSANVLTPDAGLAWIVKMMDRYAKVVIKPAFGLQPHQWLNDMDCTNEDPDHVHDVIEGFAVWFAGEMVIDA